MEWKSTMHLIQLKTSSDILKLHYILKIMDAITMMS